MVPDCVYVRLEDRTHIGAIADRDMIVSELERFLGPRR